jgi:nitric oxide reductase NorE protein
MEQTKVDYKNIFYPPGGILIWILILLELITFGAALIGLAVSSKEDPALFHKSRLMLNVVFGAVNTLFLLTSGYFMAIAMRSLKQNDFKRTLFFIKLAMGGGLLFIILKGVEYFEKFSLGITLGYNTFFNFYWLLTGFHVIHVIVGLVLLLFIFFGLKKRKGDYDVLDAEAGAAFWHMCDLIWLLLFPMLYLVL